MAPSRTALLISVGIAFVILLGFAVNPSDPRTDGSSSIMEVGLIEQTCPREIERLQNELKLERQKHSLRAETLQQQCHPTGPTRRIPSSFDQSQKKNDALIQEVFSMGGLITISKQFYDNSNNESPKFGTEWLDKTTAKIESRKSLNYMEDVYLYTMVDEFPAVFKNKDVVIPGSELPHYEVFLMKYAKARTTTTIEYRPFEVDVPGVSVQLVDDFWRKPRTFDVGFSYSNFEHDGLGRYGDPIDVDGDLKAMKEMWSIINSKGYLVLSFSIGKDCVSFNGHRKYGPARLTWMLRGWDLIKAYNFPSGEDKPTCLYTLPQGIMLLQRNDDPDSNPIYRMLRGLPRGFWTMEESP